MVVFCDLFVFSRRRRCVKVQMRGDGLSGLEVERLRFHVEWMEGGVWEGPV